MEQDHEINFDQLSDYLTGQLDKEDRERVAAALEKDPALREDLEFVKFMAAQSREETLAAVKKYKQIAEGAKIRRLSPQIIGFRIAAVAAVILALLMIFWPRESIDDELLAYANNNINENQPLSSTSMGLADLDSLKMYMKDGRFRQIVDKLRPEWEQNWKSMDTFSEGDTSRLIYALGLAHLKLSNEASSQEILNELADKSSDDYIRNQSRLVLAKLAVRKKDYGTAKELFQQVIQDPFAQGGMKNNARKAVALLEEALKK